MTSSKDLGESTQETFDWASSTLKTYLGSLNIIFYEKWTRVLNKITLSSSNAIRRQCIHIYIVVYDGNRNQNTKEMNKNVISRESKPGLLVTGQIPYNYATEPKDL